MDDGIYVDIPDREYHAQPSLSSSGAKLLLPPSVPAKFRDWADTKDDEFKSHLNFGKLVHALALGAGASIVPIDAADYRTAAARKLRDDAHARGDIPALPTEIEDAELMAARVRQHPIAGALLEQGDAEVSLFATDPDTGVKLRARPDWMTHRDGRLWLVDLKTCADANPANFGRTAEKWSYQLQFAWYHTVARMLELDESPAFVFVCVEKEPPFLVSVCELDADAYSLGRQQMRQAITIFQKCSDSGEWPGYPVEIQSVSLPPWAFNTDRAG